MCKIFANDTSLFSKVLDLDKSVTEPINGINGLINGKCNLIMIPRNKQMKLFSPIN